MFQRSYQLTQSNRSLLLFIHGVFVTPVANKNRVFLLLVKKGIVSWGGPAMRLKMIILTMIVVGRLFFH